MFNPVSKNAKIKSPYNLKNRELYSFEVLLYLLYYLCFKRLSTLISVILKRESTFVKPGKPKHWSQLSHLTF